MQDSSVIRLHEISKGLGLLVVVGPIAMVAMAVGMGVFGGTEIVHLQHVAAFRTALDWTVAGHLCW